MIALYGVSLQKKVIKMLSININELALYDITCTLGRKSFAENTNLNKFNLLKLEKFFIFLRKAPILVFMIILKCFFAFFILSLTISKCKFVIFFINLEKIKTPTIQSV